LVRTSYCSPIAACRAATVSIGQMVEGDLDRAVEIVEDVTSFSWKSGSQCSMPG
jgi:hypothetical protein